jgi:carboxymethylenebutenolidase
LTAVASPVLAAQRDAKPGPIGTTGYCMGGLMSLAAAGHFGDRIVAASYHGGRLATDAQDSPHRLAHKIRSRVYIAGASDVTLLDAKLKGGS